MKQTWRVAPAAVLILSFVAVAQAGLGGRPKETVVERGRAFCPSTTLVHGSVVIESGRCFSLAVLRDAQGTFLAFAEPGIVIPPGQTVRLDTPKGEDLRGRIVYLVPMPVTTAVPVNAIGLFRVRVDDFGPRISLTVVNTAPMLNVVIIFDTKGP